MNLFKQRKNKQFSYKSRGFKNKNDDFNSNWKQTVKTTKHRKGGLTSLPILIIFLIAILVFWYIISRYE